MDPRHQRGCKSLLKRLPLETLVSLSDTVTKKTIHFSNKSECITAIVTFSESAESLLKRRKMSRDILFKYLAEHGIVLSLQADKQEIIHKILSYWNRSYQDHEESSLKTKSTQKNKNRDEKKRPSDRASPVVSKTVSKSTVNISLSLSPNSADVDLVCETKANTNTGTFSASVHVGQRTTPTSNTNSPSTEEGTIQLLGETFTRWFFTNLNSHNPSTQENPQDFGPQHFWEDSHLQVISQTQSSETKKDSFSGAEIISKRFLAFVTEEQLLFNPNINNEGIAVKSSPHGQVMVLVCGTIHQGNCCLGIFEQLFGLLKDPQQQNNWKVKVSKLKIMASTSSTIPKLTEGSLSELRAIADV